MVSKLMTKIEVKAAVCHFCHDRCRVEIHIRDGRLESMQEDTNHPLAERIRPIVRSCPRAKAVAEWFYHPARLTYPLKRVGERGEGKWQKVSWIQALDEMAAKLKDIRDTFGAESIAGSHGTGHTHEEYRRRFFNLLGSPNYIGPGEICFGPGETVSAAVYGWPVWFPTFSRRTKCMMLLGSNPRHSWRRRWLSMIEASNAGAKLIVVDPRRTTSAARADVWLQLRPGTDTALYLSFINVIINEELYDKEFVAKWCHGFDELAQRVQDYSPEKVADITWVPAEKIKEAARTYATNKPGVIFHGMGVEHLSNSIEAIHARYILPAITGNLDVAGGEELPSQPQGFIGSFEIEANDKMPSEQKKKLIGGDRFRLSSWPAFEMILENAKLKPEGTETCFAHAPSVYRAMITGKPYPVKAMITLSSNPMVTQANTKIVYKALKSLDTYVVMDYWMTPSAELADYVLPAASWLERPMVFPYYGANRVDVGVQVMPSQVGGQYDRRPDYDLWRGLGIRLGQEEDWPWKTLEEAYNYRLAPTGATLAELASKTQGYLLARREERKYERTGFGTPTGKVELHSTIFEKLGYDPLPRYEEPKESPISTPELAKEYPLILITGARHIPFFHSEHRQIDSLRKLHPNPLVQINPETASRLGIKDGDWVWIETPRGRVRQMCEYSTGINQGVVHAQHGWWFLELPGEEPWLHGVWESNINVVTDDDPENCGQLFGGWPLRALLCKVYKVKKY